MIGRFCDWVASIYVRPARIFLPLTSTYLPDEPVWMVPLLVLLVIYILPWEIYHSLRGRSNRERTRLFVTLEIKRKIIAAQLSRVRTRTDLNRPIPHPESVHLTRVELAWLAQFKRKEKVNWKKDGF